MTKTIIVTDSSFDWLSARARPNKSVAQVIAEIIPAIDKYEKDLEKYHAWVNASQTKAPGKNGDSPAEQASL